MWLHGARRLSWWCALLAATAAAAAGAAGGSSPLTLRVRLPDGVVKRVQAEPGATLNSLLQGLDAGGAEGLARSPDASPESPDTSVAALSLKNGDFLYAVRGSKAAAAAAKARAKRVAEAKAAAAAAATARDADAWQPFPKLARPPPPTGPAQNWADLEAKEAQMYKIRPQKGKGRIKSVSVAKGTFAPFVDAPTTPGACHRCAALFGSVDEASGAIKVEALHMAAPSGAAPADDKSYDPTELLDTAGACATAAEVASLLGLRPVGWCLSHDKRDHLLSGRDVSTAAALQVRAMRDEALGRDAGAYFATITVPPDGAMAYGLSDLAVQMGSDGVWAAPLEQTDPAGPTVTATELVKDDKEAMRQPETVSLVVNLAIEEHDGFLRCKFCAAMAEALAARRKSGGGGGASGRAAATRAAGLVAMRKCLFKGGETPKPGAFLKRASDYGLLVHLARELGVSQDFRELCRCVREGDSSGAAVDKYRSSLWALCTQEDEG